MKSEGTAAKLAKLGLRSRFDLILHLPLRYEDETVLTPIAAAPPGKPVLVQARLQSAKVVFRPKRQLVVHAEGLALRFFNFYGSQVKAFERAAAQGLYVRAFGEVRGGWFGAEMAHPRYRLVQPEEPLAQALTPIYPTTGGLAQGELRKRILEALDAEALEDTLPEAIRARYGLAGFRESVELLHRPRPGVDNAAAWRRMKFDELLAQQLSMKFAYRARRARRAPALAGNGPLVNAFLKRLPFRLTRAQARALSEVTADLREPHPMQRLLQGDVGSGKTIVAAVACLIAADAGWQAAVMAPTEILSDQHWRKFSEWFGPLGVRMAWLHGGASKKLRNRLVDTQIVVGTHALIQEGVELPRLALAVIDEQHRFGVRQRLTLRHKVDQASPHQLMMSATPIPRTLYMTAYADLDVSTLDELPPGRQPVRTRLAAAQRREEVLGRIRDAVAEGQQAYWVCPVIEESREGLRTAVETHETVARELKGLRVELLHGRLPGDQKAAIMEDFKNGRIQVLVCTTVIEVGVDVPNASLMVIESAERFGLAQLHQLRGRVGRGARQSDCILLFGEHLSEPARHRLQAIFENADGFKVAELDLKLRGEGDLLGERQSGSPLLRFTDLDLDRDLVPPAQEAALWLIEADPAAARRHVERWLGTREELTHA
ncbi:MAG TPA: ATP-dependent DNA helicase RecG [Burkholderiales bacterium]|nr:ATP-dependent DNA helicase RecG [Burkholderiales bacterium]